MHYEINVSLNGQHFFATHPRSITDRLQLVKVYSALKEAFRESSGYEFRVTRQEAVGVYIGPHELSTWQDEHAVWLNEFNNFKAEKGLP